MTVVASFTLYNRKESRKRTGVIIDDHTGNKYHENADKYTGSGTNGIKGLHCRIEKNPARA